MTHYLFTHRWEVLATLVFFGVIVVSIWATIVLKEEKDYKERIKNHNS
jgi:hypothetical protein